MNAMRAELQLGMHERRLAATVTIRNGGDTRHELRFTDSGLLQLIVTKLDGTVVYDSRAGMMFAQVLRTIALEPGQTTTLAAEWAVPVTAGNAVCVRAVVRAIPPLEANGRIEL